MSRRVAPRQGLPETHRRVRRNELGGPSNVDNWVQSTNSGRSGRKPRIESPSRLPPSSGESENESEASEVPQDQSKRRPKRTTIDWRHEICCFLDLSIEPTDEELLDELDIAGAQLQDARRLKLQEMERQGPPKFQVINRIQCHETRAENGLYLDSPWVVESGRYLAHLRGSNQVRNLELYLERNKEVTFIVYRNFECCRRPPPNQSSGRPGRYASDNSSAFLVREYIEIIKDELRDSFVELSQKALGNIPHPKFEEEPPTDIESPYLWWFHSRQKIAAAQPSLSPSSQEHIAVFKNYLQIHLKDHWETVDDLLSRHKMTATYMEYLFEPGKILISNPGLGTPIAGFTIQSWLQRGDRSPEDGSFGGLIAVSSWTYDGNFQQMQSRVGINRLPSMTNEFDIRELVYFPIDYASDGLAESLRKRGKLFWKCRRRNYVQYIGALDDGMQKSMDSRFMIDTVTYKQMHPPAVGQELPRSNRDDLGSRRLAQDDPDLGDSFYMCLPSTISGFNMQKKEWVKLDIGLVEDVQWNDKAFDLLVIEPGTKELVRAVVTNQLNAEVNTDVIHGKGNGLFILLHGGPGTGKTLTAESVAEIAKKPLYRVTCGDIGTKAEVVEKYLESVLLLGKTWGCVVLLDEADVFLEQRSLHNLERNALVSVFLRVLEYYDGILILTSNRVGTFDEAFKSRIQLNLRYKNLEPSQREKIWENFIARLEELEDAKNFNHTAVNHLTRGFGIDANGIREHLPELTKPKLNGREIRNAFSTARQLAIYHKEPLGYKHLKRVIQEASKFDEYINEVHQGFSSDELQRDGMAR